MRRWAGMRRRWSELMFTGMFVLLAVVGIVNGVGVRGQFECVARYNTALQKRSEILTEVAKEDREQSQAAEKAITDLIRDAIAAAGDREKGQAAAQRYLKTSKDIADRRAELERQRRAQPFPEPPSKACT